MAPCFAWGTRRLLNILDLAMLDDIGYTINYRGVSQNPIHNGGVQQKIARVIATSGQPDSRTTSQEQRAMWMCQVYGVLISKIHYTL